MEIVTSERGLRKGAWAEEEDLLLKKCIKEYGEGRWHLVPLRSGLNRCRKSCRLRWFNYLQPNIKRGEFELDEVDLIIRMHKLLGNRWALIAGRLPGRTANDIKNYYNTHLKKSCFSKYNPENSEKGKQVATTNKSSHDTKPHHERQENDRWPILKRRRSCADINHIDDKHVVSQVLKPQPRTFKKPQWNMNKMPTPTSMNNNKTIPTTRLSDNSHVEKNITQCLSSSLVKDNDEQFSPSKDLQRVLDDSTHWVNDILFSETEEGEEKSKKRKKHPRKKKQITLNASVQFENTTSLGVEEGMWTRAKVGGSAEVADHRSFNDDKALEKGGDVSNCGQYWNDYFDDSDLWRMLGEEQHQYLML